MKPETRRCKCLHCKLLFVPDYRDRLRQVPAQFSWVDQRLVRDNFLRQADPAAWALYLVLVTVADAQGLSYYSEATLSRLLRMEPLQLADCQRQLIAADLVA